MTDFYRVSHTDLQAFAANIFKRQGLSDEHAQQVAQAMVWADLRGIDTHGVSRIPMYLKFISQQVINPQPQMHWQLDLPALMVLDADRAPGAVAMVHASDKLVARARQTGMAGVLVRATTHTGAHGFITQQMARQGMAAISMAASIPSMAYHGAAAAGVSTAPLSIAVPGPTDQPIVFDMATGVVSLGRLMQAKKLHQTLPEGWALDAQGQPTTDAALASTPLPMGGPKGSGLALMVEMLTSVLVGNPILTGLLSSDSGARQHKQNALIIALDTFQICHRDRYAQDLANTLRAIKSLPASDPAHEVLLPGERGDRMARQQLQEGIALSSALCAELTPIAKQLNIALPWLTSQAT
jgi:ureidoglycolate dehydrogenase (NAD+)